MRWQVWEAQATAWKESDLLGRKVGVAGGVSLMQEEQGSHCAQTRLPVMSMRTETVCGLRQGPDGEVED
jgi:hypothetical protein